VTAVRPLPGAHDEDGADRDVTRERGRVDVDALPVLVPPVPAESADQVASPAEKDHSGEDRHEADHLDPGTLLAACPQSRAEAEPRRARTQA
jgi:hypothetical protein